MYTEKQKKELIRDFKKDKVAVMHRLLADWGNDLYTANGRTKIVDAIMSHYIPFSRQLADKIEFAKGYKLSADWMMCAIAQIVPAEATASMFQQFNVDYNSCFKPIAKPHETVELIDFSQAVNRPEGTCVVRVILTPTEGYPAGCVVVSTKGKKYDVSTRERNGNYRIIAHEPINGKWREYVLTPFQMVKMKRIS